MSTDPDLNETQRVLFFMENHKLYFFSSKRLYLRRKESIEVKFSDFD